MARSYGLTGRHAESALRSCGLTLNRNSLPFDANGPWYTSGLRLGTAAVTTLGMGPDDMAEIADVMTSVLAGVRPATTTAADGSTTVSKAKFTLDDQLADAARKRAGDLLGRHPLYPELVLETEIPTGS